MKKLLLAAVLVLTLISLAPMPADSRPAYCESALERCYMRCQGSGGGIGFLTDSCMAGCNVGYLFC